MRLLLDTHILVWALIEPARLSPAVRGALENPDNDILFSAASVWEILIKVQAGKLPLPQPSGPYLIKQAAENRIEVLPITLDHILRIESLTMHHRDPFDRVLIAQSIEEKLPLVTADPHFERYPVEVIW